MIKPANICGPSVARLRRKMDLTQLELQHRCRAAGWPAARSALAKVENQTRSVSDYELVALAFALRVSIGRLLCVYRKAKAVSKASRKRKANAGVQHARSDR